MFINRVDQHGRVVLVVELDRVAGVDDESVGLLPRTVRAPKELLRDPGRPGPLEDELLREALLEVLALAVTGDRCDYDPLGVPRVEDLLVVGRAGRAGGEAL